MKGLYDVARHLVWLTQFGLSIVIPPVLCIMGCSMVAAAVRPGRLGRGRGRFRRRAGGGKLPARLTESHGSAGESPEAKGPAACKL